MSMLARMGSWYRWAVGALSSEPGRQTGAPSSTLVDDSARIGPDLALQISAVWACVSRRAITVASLPMFAYTNDGGRRSIDRESRLWSLFHESPNRRMTPYEFWLTMMLNHDLRGNAYARIDRDPRTGEALSLWPMPADQIETTLLDDGSVAYLYHVDKEIIPLDESQVLHLKDLGNGTVGLPRLEYMRATTTEAKNAQWQANRVFGSSGKPTGVLMVDSVLKKEQREALRERFAEMSQGNSARLFVLEANMKYQQLSLSPEDQQLLESRRFSVEEICRWFDVPPVLVHHSNVTTWGSGIEQIVDGFHKFTIRPMIVSIEQAIRKRVMTPAQRASQTVEFNYDALLRASLKDRMEIYSKAVQNGIYSRNECRQLENEPPYAGGEIFTVQSNLAPVDKLGQEPPPPAPPAPTDEEKAAALRSEERHGEILKALAPQPINVSLPAFTVHTHASKVDVTMQPAAAPEVHIENRVEPPKVDVKVEPAAAPQVTVENHVEPTPIDVKLEATLPPPEVRVELPPRRTETTVQRDSDGNIVRTTQIERDA